MNRIMALCASAVVAIGSLQLKGGKTPGKENAVNEDKGKSQSSQDGDDKRVFIMGIPELYHRAANLNGRKITVTGFIGSRGGGVFIAATRDILNLTTAAHEKVYITGDGVDEITGGVNKGLLFGQYVYVTGFLDYRASTEKDPHFDTQLSLINANVQFLELDEMELVR